MTTLLAYITEGLVTLLPEGWRAWYAPDEDLYRAAGVCGVLEYALSAGILLTRFIHFLQTSMAGLGASAVARNREEALAAVQYHVGLVFSTQYLLSPLTILLAYLTCEGLVRLLASAVTHEVLGTAPLYLVARMWKLASALAGRPAGVDAIGAADPGLGIVPDGPKIGSRKAKKRLATPPGAR